MTVVGKGLSDFELGSMAKSAGSDKSDNTNEGLKVPDPNKLAQALGKVVIPGLPINLGSAPPEGGVTANLNTKGFAENPILQSPLLPNSNGGLLAKLVSDIFLKNLTMGVGGGEAVYSQEGGLRPTPVAATGGGKDSGIDL